MSATWGLRLQMPAYGLIAQLASTQHGVVARWQLLAGGVSGKTIDHLVAIGHLHVVHLGVYAVGHPAITDSGRCMAAALAGGEGALIGHRSSAIRWGIDRGPAQTWTDVLVPRGRCRRRRGIVFHRTRFLPDEDRSSVDGIPVTSIARTLRDSARSSGPIRLRRLFDEADRLGLLDRADLRQVLDRSAGHCGIRPLYLLLDRFDAPPPRTRSPLEHRFFRIWEAAGLPTPETNVRLCGFEVDCLWRREKVVVELDGQAFHHTGVALELDDMKDGKLEHNGYLVLRFNYRDVFERPDWVVEQVRSALGGTR